MSMVRCDDCNALIDSDIDTECFGGPNATVCQWCRDKDEVLYRRRFPENEGTFQ